MVCLFVCSTGIYLIGMVTTPHSFRTRAKNKYFEQKNSAKSTKKNKIKSKITIHAFNFLKMYNMWHKLTLKQIEKERMK